MDEYISRKAAIDATYALHFKDSIQEALRNLPAADVRPARYGKWEKHGWSIRCSECGYDMPFATRNFCPNCGAEMEES